MSSTLARPLGSFSRAGAAAARATGYRSPSSSSSWSVKTTCRRGLRTSTSSLVGGQRIDAKRLPTTRPSSCFFLGQKQQQQQQQLRWKSQTLSSNSNNPSDNELGQGDAPQVKRWGFEDVNAVLPSSPDQQSPRAILVDVREPAELSSTGIIPTAVSIPLASQPDALFLPPDEFETRFGFPKPGASSTATLAEHKNIELDELGEVKDVEDKPIVFYCRAGVRARAAAQLALQAGYDPAKVGVYDGSWLDWVERGGRVEKWEGKAEE